MVTTLIIQQLLTNLVTVQQAILFIKGINQLSGKLYKTDQSWELKSSQYLTAMQADIVQTVLKSQKISLDSPVAIEDSLISLKKIINQLPRLSLQLAIDLPLAKIKNISQWVRNETGKHMLLDITLNSSLIGGAIIYKQGIGNDFSVKKNLENYFANSDTQSLISL